MESLVRGIRVRMETEEECILYVQYLAGQLRVEQFVTMLVEGLDRVHLLR